MSHISSHGAPLCDACAKAIRGRFAIRILLVEDNPELSRRLTEGLYEAEMRVAAFQNGYYVALCNRVGREEKLTFAGESFVCGPDGTVIARARLGTDEILCADVDFTQNESSNARRLFMRDRRPELYAGWIER